MKTQEEKAKAYDEALEKAKKLYEKGTITESIDYIFPELEKSEDEKIRKELYDFCIKCSRGDTLVNQQADFQRWAAWLEKQGEKPQGKTALEAVEEEKVDNANKVEPKFKVGDWVVTDKNGVVQIKAIKNDNYVLENASKFSVYYVDKCWKKWGISDAKDGDVLYSLDSNQPFIYKERNIYEQATAYCGINKYGKFFVWNAKDCVITLDKYIPATKEQRDALMKAMADAGYTFDFDKKELKKINLLLGVKRMKE